MKVLQSIAGFGFQCGGTTTCTYDLLEAINRNEIIVDLLTPEPSPRSNDVLVGAGKPWLKAFPYDYKTPFCFSSHLRKFIHQNNEYDLYHTNGTWLYVNHLTASYARRHKKPYIITPHGMLYPGPLARSSFRKKLMRKLCFNKDFRMASALHATCLQEARYLREFGLKNPIAVIPNPVKIPDNIDAIVKTMGKERESEIKIGYLGRLHPTKNVDRIIKAFASRAEKHHRLVIMGKGDAEYEKYLRDLVKESGAQNVSFEGFVRGEKKLRKLASLRALVVASVSENFGMIVPEALMCHTPVICTTTAPWEDLETFDCGRWVENDVETLGNNIHDFVQMPLSEIQRMGENGHALITREYVPEVISGQMRQLYEWLTGVGQKPSFVM